MTKEPQLITKEPPIVIYATVKCRVKSRPPIQIVDDSIFYAFAAGFPRMEIADLPLAQPLLFYASVR